MTGWGSAAAPAAVAAAVLLVPGLLVGRAAGLKGLLWAAAAPALSVGVVALSAVAAAVAGQRWGLLPVAVGTALAVVGALPVGVLSGSLAGARRARSSGRRAPGPVGLLGALGLGPRDLAVGLAAAGGLMAGGVLAGHRLLAALWAPTAVSQSFDAVFHLNAVRWVLDTGDGSSLHLGRLTSPGADTSFYPAGWHDVVSLAAGATGAGVDVASNATAAVVALVVWPLGAVGLVRVVVGRRPVAVAAAGALTAAFTSLPVSPLEWGVLYPTLLTTSLLPGVLALLVAAADRVRGLRRRAGAVLVAAGALPGLALAQPSGGFALAAVALPLGVSLLVATVRGWWRSGVRLPAVVLPVVAALLAVTAWRYATTMPSVLSAASTPWAPMVSPAAAVKQAVLFEHLSRTELVRPALWVTAALVLAGLLVVLGRRRLRWVAGSHLLVSTLFVLAWGVGAPWSRVYTGFWFNDAYRIAPLTVITGLVLASAAVALVPPAVRRAWRQLHRSLAGQPARPAQPVLAAHATAPATGPVTGRRSALRAGVPAPRAQPDQQGRRGQRGERGRRRAPTEVRAASTRRWVTASAGGAAIAVVVVLAGARGPGYAATYRALWENSVAAAPGTLDAQGHELSDVLDSDERALLDRLDAEVPAGVEVAGNPWNGSGFVYALTGHPTPFPHMVSKFEAAPDRAVVAERLSAAATDPTVCPAVRELHLGYVLDFGTGYLWGGDDEKAGRDRRYPGLEGLATAEGFRLVDSEGRARLYEITACGA
ncbi:DUF6541 family protein [Quadrisphaera sp. INWT6]|uniref:DUF6541 family protein n=1 Tax=Quadrisphaera sp. INWT6 TaxID=2596917 RepID=UPI0018920DD7|nr:DUF6541 family protein [Quadrisphaera sp. INWT6]MBF5081467.1 hypothetical protein [Quadrisphaera sp. INWT6]